MNNEQNNNYNNGQIYNQNNQQMPYNNQNGQMQYQNQQYNDQNGQMQYQNQQYNGQYQHMQYNQQQYQNQQYNNQYQNQQPEQYKIKSTKKADGSGVGGALGTIVGLVILVGICVGIGLLVKHYFDTNKTVICTAQGGGYNVTAKIKLNNKEKEVKSFEMKYTIQPDDDLADGDLYTIMTFLSFASDNKYLYDVDGVKYDYNGPDVSDIYYYSSSNIKKELKDYNGKEINFKLKINKKNAGAAAILILSEFENKDVEELIEYMEKDSGFNCYEQ